MRFHTSENSLETLKQRRKDAHTHNIYNAQDEGRRGEGGGVTIDSTRKKEGARAGGKESPAPCRRAS